jgi:sodium-dependent phosphate cotransporter
MPTLRTPLRFVVLIAAAAAFLLALGIITEAGTTLGRSTLERFLTLYNGPVTALALGVLATAVFQSSSATTSIVVALVAGGAIPLSTAVPVILGANVGTTLTSTLAAFGTSTVPAEFSRGLSAAALHDLFNVCLALFFLPLEIAFGLVSRLSLALSDALSPVLGRESAAPASADLLTEVALPPWLLLAVGVVLLVLALRVGVAVLQSSVIKHSERLMQPGFTERPVVAFAGGLGLTSVVQSSSLTTSLVVPLAASGLWRADRLLPYTLGANLGTTVTALFAALATVPASAESNPALTAACAHFIVNLAGVVAFSIVRGLRNRLVQAASRIAELAGGRRRTALIYVLGLFFLLPSLVLLAGALA